MFPFGLAIGFVAGAVGAILFAPQIAQHARPVAKAVLKTALTAMHEAQVRSAEVAEAAEDLCAEAKAELNAERSEAAVAATESHAWREEAEPRTHSRGTAGRGRRRPSAAA
jgi:gas vesicle protein